MLRHNLLAVIVGVICFTTKGALGFSTTTPRKDISSLQSSRNECKKLLPSHNFPIHRSATELMGTLVPSAITAGLLKVSPAVKAAVFLSAAFIAVAKRRQILYPGTKPDSNFEEPLPDGSFGCPFFGSNIFQGNKESGPGLFYRKKSAEVGNQGIFKYMAFGKPIIQVTSMDNVRQVFGTEFKSIRVGIVLKKVGQIFGLTALTTVTDSDKHSFLRRLVGQSMTPNSITQAIPALTQAANDQIDQILLQSSIGNNVVMEDVLTNFTLDIAYKQILGLDLEKEEVGTFQQAVNDWVHGITDLRTIILPGIKNSKAGKAYTYLVEKIERKIDQLERNGPDGSTLSAMLFAEDEENSKKLTRTEVIDNSLLLILAGSETSASTLTVATLLLGLHPEVYQKIRDEQHGLIAKYGETITRQQMDKESPYLDAVVKETMRLKPLTGGGIMRLAEETLVVDGKQIPKGYGVTFNIALTHTLDPVTKKEDGSHMDLVKGFQPERWLDAETEPSDFMGFGYGARYCLGANLAMAEMKIFLALLARRVDFDLVNMNKDNITWKKASIIPKPEDGAMISPRPFNLAKTAVA